MARAFILGHGARVSGRGKTFVPEGKSISFYSEVDEDTLRANGLAALNAGDIPPVEKFDAKSEVDNYELSRFEDGAIAQHMASESSLTGGKSYFIGLETSFQSTPLPSPLRLCTTPEECARTNPRHSASCKGLFALVPEEELLSVTCRGVRGRVSLDTIRLGASKLDEKGQDVSEEFTRERWAEAQRLLTLRQTDPAAVIAHIESLSEATRQMLLSSVPLRTFVEEYYKQGGASTPEAVLEARRALEAMGEDSFADRVDMYGEKQKQMVLADPGLRAGYERSVQKRLQAKLGDGDADLEAIERQRIMREQAQPQIEALRRRQEPVAVTVTGTVPTEVVPTPETVLEVSKEKEKTDATNAPGKQLVSAKLLELSKEKTNDPYRKMAIALMTKRIASRNKADG